jgi:hypothetical protein
MEAFTEMRQQFEVRNDGLAAKTVREWERGEITGAQAVAAEPSLKGMCIPLAKFEDPIFTLFVEAGGPKPGIIFYMRTTRC